MTYNDDAKKAFFSTAHAHPTRMVENYEALIELAKSIADADKAMLKVEPQSVIHAVRYILGVD